MNDFCTRQMDLRIFWISSIDLEVRLRAVDLDALISSTSRIYGFDKNPDKTINFEIQDEYPFEDFDGTSRVDGWKLPPVQVSGISK
ncbi:MAG: hypothetical protein ABL962_06615, partial [Fimbriimonadaceae bacterium]